MTRSGGAARGVGTAAEAGMHDVIVVGDGPAGSALARSLHTRGVDVLLVGRDDPWTATYGVWRDEIAGAEAVAATGAGLDEMVVSSVSPMRVLAHTERLMDRIYAVVDNGALRATLRNDVHHLVGAAQRAAPDGDGWVVEVEANGARISRRAAVLVDATGWPRRLGGLHGPPASPVAWQTAWGAVLDEPPDGPLGTPTVMDWSPPGGLENPVPTFGYCLPVADGWLVEETVLAARHPVEPELLRPVLARRLGRSLADLDRHTVRLETVCIPMGTPIPGSARGADDERLPVPYGAAAGFAHPATGYQIAPALTLAGPVAAAIVGALDASPDDRESLVLDAIWSTPRRRTRALHEFGLDVLLRLDHAGLRDFFETFFALPDELWTAQMRIDTPPARIWRMMTQMFWSAPWNLRKQLVSGDLRLAAGVVSPGSEGVRAWSRRRILPRPRSA